MRCCIVLAGGESTRMGRDKRFLKVDGEYLLSRVVSVVREFADDLIISLGEGEEVEERAGLADARFVRDERPGLGPMMGILTGLRDCNEEYCAVVPCDSPYIKPEVFRFMFSVSKGYDAVVPLLGTGRDGAEKIEPLHAIYRVPSMLKACEKVLGDGGRGVREAIAELKKVNYVQVRELKKYDSKLLTFLNVNSPRDLKKIEEVLG